MTNRSRDRWRRNAPRKDPRESAVERSWRRGKRKKQKSAASGRGWNVGRVLKPLAAATLLIAIVAFTIWIFMRGEKVHTHVIVLDMLEGCDNFDHTSLPPSFKAQPGRFRGWGRITVETPNSFDVSAKTSVDRDDADVLVIYLHANIVAGTDNEEYWCLVGNSSPDLSRPEEYTPLSKLNEQITAIRKRARKAKAVVLLVDQPPIKPDWRTGVLKTTVNKELERWTSIEVPVNEDGEIEKPVPLIVVTSCSDTEQSAPGRNGQTAFGMIVSRAWSQIANSDFDADKEDGFRWKKPNNPLTIREFCDYVRENTNSWVRRHRHPAGQTVQIFPPLEKLEESGQSMPLLAEPPKVADLPKPKPLDPKTMSLLIQSWRQRDALDERLAWRWAPLQWQSATEYLLRAENALLDGNAVLAEKLGKKAEAELGHLEHAVSRVSGADNNTDSRVNEHSGIPRSWFAKLPAGHRLNGLWTVDGAADDAIKAPDTVAEDVLRANVAKYPFSELGLHPPDEAFTRNRTEAEDTVAGLLTVTGPLRQTVLAAEQKLLNLEDRVFTQKTDSGDDDRGSDWVQMRKFAKAYQAAELVFQRTLSRSESLARWAATTPLDPEFRNILIEHVKTESLTQEGADSWRGEDTGSLRIEVFRLLVAARMTGTLVTFYSDPANTEALAVKKQKLIDWTKKTNDSQKKVDRLLQTLVDGLKTSANRADKDAEEYRQLRAVLEIPQLLPPDRRKLIENVSDLDGRSDFEHPDVNANPGDPSPNFETTTPPSQIALWQLQYLSLFQLSNNRNEHFVAATEVIAGDSKSGTSDSLNHTQLATFGSEVRSFWKDSREAITKPARTVGDSESASTIDAITTQLRHHDLICRGLSAFDVSKLGERSPTQALHAVWQIDYCLLHANRLLKSQWIEPGASSPQDGWYSRRTRDWLDAAKRLNAENNGALRQWQRESISGEIQKLDGRLNNSWSFSAWAHPPRDAVDIAQGSVGGEGRSVDITLKVRNLPDDLRGTAALQYLPALAEQVNFKAAENRIQFNQNVQPYELSGEGGPSRNTLHHPGNWSSVREGCETLDFVTRLFFRGRNWPETNRAAEQDSPGLLTVNPCTPASYLVTRTTRPDDASVHLHGADKRRIAFILDMSLSMKKPKDSPRYKQAISTLKTIVQDLDNLTEVTLFVFGHRRKYNEALTAGLSNERYKTAFDPPDEKDWEKDPFDDVERVFPVDNRTRQPLGAKGRDVLADVLSKVEHCGPYGITPLAFAIIEALDSFGSNETGVVVAITDGIALDVGLTKDGKPGLSKFDRRSRLKKTNDKHKQVKTQIIAFDVEENEAQALNSVFKDEFDFSVSTATTAHGDGDLAEKIMSALPTREYEVRREGKLEGKALFNNKLTGLTPGDDYNISYVDTEASGLHLGPGDDLNVTVDWQKDEFTFHQAFPGSFELQAVGNRQDDDTPTKLRARIERKKDPENKGPGGEECYKYSLELMLDHNNEERPVRQPAEVEFQLLPKGLQSRPKYWPTQIIEEFTGQWGAPGYHIEVLGWPTGDELPVPRIQARWKMAPTTPDHVVSLNELLDGNACRLTPKEHHKNLPNTEVTVDLLRLRGVLQVRLTPLDGPLPDPKFSEHDAGAWQLRVELGNTGVEQELSYYEREPEVKTTIEVFEDGHVTYEFHGNYEDENALKAKNLELGFTSGKSRWEDAFTVEGEIAVGRIIE